MKNRRRFDFVFLPFASSDGQTVEILDGRTPVQYEWTIIVTFVRRVETRIIFQGERFQLVEREEETHFSQIFQFVIGNDQRSQGFRPKLCAESQTIDQISSKVQKLERDVISFD